jgi:Predicted membrane protein
MLIDKQRAIHKEWRIPEKTLIGVSLFGGAVGMLLGMSSFKHKTKHKKFTIGVPFILLMHICLFILYLYY